MHLDAWGYLGAFAGALALSAVLTPVALRLALRWGALDRPGAHKGHAAPVPYLGGAAIVIAFAGAIAAASLWQPPAAHLDQLLVILGCAVALAVVGLVDDVRGLPPWARLVAQAGAGAAVWAIGAGTGVAPTEWLDAGLTVAWVVAVTNAVNLLDNMDGLSAGVTAIAGLAFFGIAALNGQFLVAGLAVALAGCALGFLAHNFHPARIYMGDAGSLFLGFLLAVLGVRLRLVDTPQLLALFVPVLVLGVAVFDTSLVVMDRLRHGRSPLQGGRDHTSHRLAQVGVPVPATVVLIYATAAALGWLAALLARLDVVSGLMLLGFVAAVGAVLFALLLRVPTHVSGRATHRSDRTRIPPDDSAPSS